MLAGVDEVGRGPLAGPVVAAAVILDPDDPRTGDYRDSKKLSAARRHALYHHLRAHAASYSLGWATVAEIDRVNIHAATLLAMERAVLALPVQPGRVLVDGKHPPALPIPVAAVVGGDDRIPAIAAASIIAKVVRDRFMRRIDGLYPCYGFARHKGYGTPEHLAALGVHGPCPWHRTSFSPVAALLPKQDETS